MQATEACEWKRRDEPHTAARPPCIVLWAVEKVFTACSPYVVSLVSERGLKEGSHLYARC
jgi:hypothetical protein